MANPGAAADTGVENPSDPPPSAGAGGGSARNRPHVVAGFTHPAGRGLDNPNGSGGVVVAVIQVVARYLSYIGFSATHHAHHARLKKRYYLQFRRSREEHLVR